MSRILEFKIEAIRFIKYSNGIIKIVAKNKGFLNIEIEGN